MTVVWDSNTKQFLEDIFLLLSKNCYLIQQNFAYVIHEQVKSSHKFIISLSSKLLSKNVNQHSHQNFFYSLVALISWLQVKNTTKLTKVILWKSVAHTIYWFLKYFYIVLYTVYL